MGILGEYRKATSLATNLSKSLSSVVQMEPKKEKIAFKYGTQRDIMTNAFQAIVDVVGVAGDIKEERDLKKEFETYLEDVPGAKSEKGDMWNLWQKRYKTEEGKDIVPSSLIQQGRAGYGLGDEPKGYFAGARKTTTPTKKIPTTPSGGGVKSSGLQNVTSKSNIDLGLGRKDATLFFLNEFETSTQPSGASGYFDWKNKLREKGIKFATPEEYFDYYQEHGKDIP